MKILITGATGLTGKEIGKKLVAEGHEITVLTRNINKAKSSLPFPENFLNWEHYSQALVSGPFVKADVMKIFSYRKKIIAQIFY